jgi:gamma-glutamylcyclotransferase (GGCT)/AIG2-like uncharacterized protein YtfP
VSQLIFFYGTLMTPFNRPGRRRIDSHLVFKGNGSMTAALFDLGIYPAAVPAGSENARVRGEVYEMTDAPAVLYTPLRFAFSVSRNSEITARTRSDGSTNSIPVR